MPSPLHYLCKHLLCIVCLSFFTLSPLKASITFEVNYRDAATIFDIMDNVALWRTDGFCDPHYRPYWDKKFSSSAQDEAFFKKYAQLRKKYFIESPDSESNTFFLPQSFLQQDPIASIFYSAATLEHALTNLATLLTPEEISFLKSFYKHFESRYSPLLKGKPPFPLAIKSEKKKLSDPKVAEYLNAVAAFYQVHEPLSFSVLHTWFPPLNQTSAVLSGKNFILRSNPDHHGDEDQTDIILHEVIYALSSNQSPKNKQTLTKRFVAAAPSSLPQDTYRILETPLAVALGQMLYLDLFEPSKFKECQDKNNWYMDEWVNDYAKAMYPRVKKAILSHEVLNEALIEELAKLAPKQNDRSSLN